VQLVSFTAQKNGGTDVLLQWRMAGEAGVARYEPELARGNAEWQSGHFVKLGELPSSGSTGLVDQAFTDREADKFGPRYYRLKIINTDGSFYYSPVRPVVFDEAVLWKVYPKPSSGRFNFV
jgi:hypothetical protein